MSKFELFKLLAPGFLPLIIFIVADSFWGVTAGLIIAVAAGAVELALSYFREKHLDRFVFLDTGLIILLGGISLSLKNDIFFKLKPVLIEVIFCLLLGISAFSRFNLVAMMSQRYLKHLAFDPKQLDKMKASMRILFFIFLVHTLLVAYSAFFMSRKAWAFISGGLFYILFFVFFLAEVLRLRVRRKREATQYAGEEWFDLVDTNGRVIGRAPRSQVHAGKGMLHPVVHLQVINSKNCIFLQKRSKAKEIQPGKWDTAVGGHVRSGESMENALKREAAEELSLTDFKAMLLGRYVWESEIESELVFMFIARLDTVTRINPQEMEEGKFWRIKKIKENLQKEIFTPNFEFEFGLLLKSIFE